MLSDFFSNAPRSGFAVAVALAAGLLLAACSVPPQEPAAPAPPPVLAARSPLPEPAPTVQPVTTSAAPMTARALAPLEPLNTLLAYAERVRGLSGNDLALEITRLGEPADGSIAQTQLAIALLQTHLPNDTARALVLLQRAAATPGNDATALQPFNRLLVARATEQRRLEDTVDRQNQQLRDSQKRIDQLNERLEAMRAIERSLTSRPGAPSVSNGRAPQAQ